MDCRTEPEPPSASIQFSDRGKPYDPFSRQDPDISLSAEDRAIGGLGVFMVKEMMDEVGYEYRNDQNILTLVKRF
ncbi:hypothetical protein SDC9_122489 [bioreactor metagenome]|uniref:Histidine kinase/HSP90-like ATPase domain-containing protein n=1 Tax=bioreactor metagenome TaxID=1076179 RepID=A0A645CEV6_9ZZZZ